MSNNTFIVTVVRQCPRNKGHEDEAVANQLTPTGKLMAHLMRQRLEKKGYIQRKSKRFISQQERTAATDKLVFGHEGETIGEQPCKIKDLDNLKSTASGAVQREGTLEFADELFNKHYRQLIQIPHPDRVVQDSLQAGRELARVYALLAGPHHKQLFGWMKGGFDKIFYQAYMDRPKNDPLRICLVVHDNWADIFQAWARVGIADPRLLNTMEFIPGKYLDEETGGVKYPLDRGYVKYGEAVIVEGKFDSEKPMPVKIMKVHRIGLPRLFRDEHMVAAINDFGNNTEVNLADAL